MNLGKKLVFGSAIALMGLGVLVGCGANNEGANGDGPVELTIATWANEQEGQEFDEIIDKLNDSQDKYELKQNMIPQDYYTVLQTQIGGNTAPDLFWLAQEYIPAYATNGALADLTDLLEQQEQIDMADFYPDVLNTAKYQDSLFGLPFIGQPFVVYYNKEMFDEKGLEAPADDWTWEDFKKAATALTDKDTYGFATLGAPPTAVFTWGEGGEIVDKDGKVLLDTPESIKGLELANSIINSDFTMPNAEVQSMGVEQAFATGEVAMFVGGANDSVEKAVANAKGFEVGMAQVPAGSKKQVTFNWTASTIVSSATKHEEVAKQAMLDLTEAMLEWKVPAPVKSKMALIGEINPDKAYAVDTIKKAAEMSRGFNNMPQQNELGTIQWDELDNVLLTNNDGRGNIDVSKLAETVAQKFRDIIGN